jgi:hypothetical protein
VVASDLWPDVALGPPVISRYWWPLRQFVFFSEDTETFFGNYDSAIYIWRPDAWRELYYHQILSFAVVSIF